MATNKKTVLITGASAGIGAAFADVFARNQWDLVLTARREDRLKDLADKLRTQYGCDVETIQADLAKPEAPQHIFDQLQANNTKLQGLVNNAGYGVPGYYTGTPWQQQQDFIQVLVTAVAHLCHLFLPHMVEQGYGRIINVSSINGLLPCSPGQTLYSGAKSFVVGLSQTLHAEAGKHGVHVNALCPGLTYTEFHDVTGTREMVNRVPKSQAYTKY